MAMWPGDELPRPHMTLRQYYAGLVMAAFVPTAKGSAEELGPMIAGISVAFADALIAELGKDAHK